MLATANIFLFQEFRLDRRGEGLSRRDDRGMFVPVAIGPRALDLLAVLVERPGELVRKEEIMATVWGRAAVESANLTVQISALRRVLDKGRAEGSCIQTVAARGYRFVAPVTRLNVRTGPERSTASSEIRETEAATGPVPSNASRVQMVADLPQSPARSPMPGRLRIALLGTALTVAATILVAAATWWAHPGPTAPSAQRQSRLCRGRRARPACRSSCCRLPTSAMTPVSSILPTGSPMI